MPIWRIWIWTMRASGFTFKLSTLLSTNAWRGGVPKCGNVRSISSISPGKYLFELKGQLHLNETFALFTWNQTLHSDLVPFPSLLNLHYCSDSGEGKRFIFFCNITMLQCCAQQEENYGINRETVKRIISLATGFD